MPDADATLLAVRAGVDRDSAFGAVMPPLHLSANFSFAGLGQPGTYDYSRCGNPTRDVLAETLAGLEHGAGAVITASGMAALDLVLSLLRPGQLVVAPHDCYGGTHRLLTERARRGAFELRFVDQADPEALNAALAGGVRLVLIETPSNPLLRVVDVAAVAARAHAAGAQVAADNTFLSPALQRPIALGADFVVHSTTKYLNGHSDVIGGAVVARDPADVETLRTWATTTGVAGSPFDAYLTTRGLRTLFVRIARQQVSAQRVAEALAAHPAVERVFYPGLPEHPGHDLAKRQQDGFGAVVSFRVRGGEAGVRALLAELKLFTLAESLGGVESLIAHPATMTHASMSPETQRAAGITRDLLRLSIGLEPEEALVADLIGALDRVVPARGEAA